MNTIGLCELRLLCFVGTLEHEKAAPQELLLTLEVECTTPKDDQLLHTIDYMQLATLCQEVAASRHHQLIEILAERIADALLARFEISRLFLRIEKPSAHPLARCAFVQLKREKTK